MPLQRGSFAFYPKTTQPHITRGCTHQNEHGSAYLSMIWPQHGMGLTQESNRALPYLKRGRGNPRDKCIYFSTGLFAGGAGRKRLFGIQAASCFAGEAAGRAAACRALAGMSSGRAASPQPPAQPVERGPCWGQGNWPVGSFTLAGRLCPCAGKGHHPAP